jgi:hypothetical protein
MSYIVSSEVAINADSQSLTFTLAPAPKFFGSRIQPVGGTYTPRPSAPTPTQYLPRNPYTGKIL